MANRIVTATVTGETIKLSDKNAGAAGSFNAVSLALTFDSAWDGTTKKLYFFDSFYANPVYILLTVDYYNSETGVYTVPIPAEPLAYAGNMTITIKGVDFATDGTTAERIIMSASTEMKVASAIIPSTDTAPAEPTPTQAEQLQGEIDGIITDLAAVPAAVTAAQNSATAASGSATAAAQSATDAETAQGLAEAAQASTEATAAAFDSNATAKTTAFNDNATAKTTAFNDNATSKTSAFDLNAANANTTIDGKVTTATNAATAAQAAQTAAEGARDLATSAKTAAELAETNAETAQGLAEAAKTAAELAETHAETAETNAGTYATNASNSATAAAGSATDANASKLAAQTAQTNAETAENNAETAEANATAKAVLAESYAKGGTGTRAGEDTDNALYYKNQAQEIVGGDYPTKSEAQGYVSTHDASGAAHATLFGGKVDKVTGKGLSTEDYTTAEKTKLAGVAENANNYAHPANHPASIITQDASNRFVTDTEKGTWNGKLDASQKGVANGIASLDSTGKVPSGQLPEISAGLLPQIIVTTQADATVTATSGGETVSGTATGGTCTLDIPAFGTWTVTVTKGSDTNSNTVIVDTVKIYEINIQFYHVYGFTINEAESNPLVSVTYTDKATSFSKGSVAWDTSPLFENIKPCLFKNGAVVGYLQRNDYTKFEDGSSADITSGNAGDVMVEIPKMAYYMEKSGNIITAKVLIGDVDAKTVDARYSYLPFSRNAEGDRDKIYIGAYLGFELSSKLRSLSGKSPTANKTIGAFRTVAQANGTGYQQFPFYQLTLIQILYIMKYGSLNSQVALGRGFVDGNAAKTNTGGANSRGFCYGETTGKQQMKIFGIEDFWGNLYQWIDGLFCNASWAIRTTYKAFNDTGSGYLFNNSSGNSANTGGYMNVSQGGTQTGFNIKTAAGSDSTYYSDTAILNTGCLPNFGGSWANASNAGAFLLNVTYSASYADSSIGARLCYI